MIPTETDINKLNDVVERNIRATFPKPKQGKRKPRSRSNMKAAQRVSVLEDSIN